MAKTKRKAKKDKTSEPPETSYPSTPHIVGMDWIELAVKSPARTAALYRSIGLSPRTTAGRSPRLAVGGLVIQLRPSGVKRDGVGASKPSGVRIQLAVDHVEVKRRQLCDIGLTPGPFKRLKRGDRAFDWQDPDGHTVRFVGPAREGKK